MILDNGLFPITAGRSGIRHGGELTRIECIGEKFTSGLQMLGRVPHPNGWQQSPILLDIGHRSRWHQWIKAILVEFCSCNHL